MTSIVKNDHSPSGTSAVNRSLLTENRKVVALKPSDRLQNRILLFIQRLFYRILNWLYPFERTNYVGIVHALDPSSAQSVPLSRDILWAYFHRFAKEDAPTQGTVRSCIEDVQTQYRAVESGDAKALHALKDKAMQLQEGQQIVAVAKKMDNDDLFYLFSRKEGQMHLKVVGKGETFSKLAGMQQDPSRVQSVSYIDYGAITATLVNDLLRYSHLDGHGDRGDGDQAEILKLLAEQPKTLHTASDLSQEMTGSLRLFLTLFGEVEKNKGASEAECIRTQLRLEMFTLFNLLQDVRKQWTPDLHDRRALDQMLRVCSSHLLLAVRAGYVSAQEVDPITAELIEMQKCIDAEHKRGATSLGRLAMPSMDIYTLSPFQPVPPPAHYQTVKTPTSSARPLREMPPSAGERLICRPRRKDPSVPVLEQLQKLVAQNAGQSEIIRALYEIEPPQDYKEWSTMDSLQAKQTMEHLNTLSVRLMQSCIANQEVSSEAYEVLFKMSMMVAGLSPHPRKETNRDELIIGMQLRLSRHLKFSRSGYALHHDRLRIYQELKRFFSYDNLGSLHSHTRTGGFAPYGDPVNFHLELQMHLLLHCSGGYYSKFDSFFLQGWIPSLPISLLAAYYTKHIVIEKEDYYDLVKMDNITPEEIQQDPKQTLDSARDHALQDALPNSRTYLNDYMNTWFGGGHSGHTLTYLSWSDHFSDAVLKASPFSGQTLKSWFPTRMKRQEAYLQDCVRLEKEIHLSNEERTALLALMRAKEPQRELLAFMEKYPVLLSYPSIRDYVELLFFAPSLLDTLKDDKTSYRREGAAFCQLLPTWLSGKIHTYMQKAEKGGAPDIQQLLFFVQMSERLKGIYRQLQSGKVEGDRDKRWKYATDAFFDMQDRPLQQTLRLVPYQGLTAQDRSCLLTVQLRALLAKPNLTQEEVCRIALLMQQVEAEIASCPTTYSGHVELFSLKESYKHMIRQERESPILEKAHIDYLLDQLCQQKGCELDGSAWTALAPEGLFSNGRYRVNLVDLTLEDTQAHTTASTLPGSIVHSSLFKKSFPDLEKMAVKAQLKKEADGTSLYYFQDTQNNPCCALLKAGACTLYRSFPKAGHPQFFQAEMLTEPPLPGAPSNEIVAPVLLQRPIFFDPLSGKGYLISSSGELEFEVRLKQKSTKIDAIVDLRQAGAVPMQLTALTEVKHPALRQLEQIEHPSQILVWGKKGGSVEKIELSRYGLSFIVKDDALVCTDPQLAGYRIAFNATLREKKGIDCALLLEHPDYTRPKKLLLASARHIQQNMQFAGSYLGLAAVIIAIIGCIKRFFIRGNAAAAGNSSQFYHPHLGIETEENDLRFSVIDLNPHTEEFVFAQGIEQRQELILHALKYKDPLLALEALHTLEIENEKEKISKWLQFLNKLSHMQDAPADAIALRLIEKCETRLKGQRRFKEELEELKRLKDLILPRYLKQAKTLLTPFRLSQEMVDVLTKDAPALSPIYALEMRLLQEPLKLKREDLGQKLPLNEGASLLFTRAEVEKLSLDKLLKEKIRPKRQEIQRKKTQAKEKLDQMLVFSMDSVDQLAILGKEKRMASLADLSIALLQNNLEGLKPNLPKGIDCAELKKALIAFFDLEVQFHLLVRSEEEALKKAADTCLDLLTYKRHYDPHESPELLIFESFHFMTFRNGANASQLHLLQQLIGTPASIVQAGTGSGKSAVLSVLRGLMRAKGNSLVTQKVLPHLYQETLTILKQRLGGTFKRKVYPLLFNQSMPVYDAQGNSLFEMLYQNLLETMQNRGCVLTDYKSLPLLEEKFIALSRIIATDSKEATPIFIKHWLYLFKILRLLKGYNDELMDEFDGPLSAVQQIQTQIQQGPSLKSWKLKTALELYKELSDTKKYPNLLLEKNLQGDISQTARKESIRKLARHMAEQFSKHDKTLEEPIFQYLTGENAAVLPRIAGWQPRQKDRLAFVKDQCLTYLPLTLDHSRLSNYRRHKEGDKIVVCAKGQPREAKFGNPIEDVNYLIQDYLQSGIAHLPLRSFLLDAIKDWRADPVGGQKRLDDVLGDLHVVLADLAKLSPDDFEERVTQLLPAVNKQPKIVQHFLWMHLSQLKKSGRVISMDPQAIVSMSLAVSGLSATTGSLGSLHTQFQRDEDTAKTVQEQQLLRLKGRSYAPPKTYDPFQPLAVFDTVKGIPTFCSVIDASGAFRSVPPKQVAEAMRTANPVLKRVDYYDEQGAVAFIGDPTAPLEERGFYFPEAQTRGSDQVLRPDGVALLLTRKKGGVEDFIQEEGRMRHAQQKVLVALSHFDALDSLEELIQHKQENDKEANAKDRYRAEIQRLRQAVRASARDRLLKTDLKPIEHLLDGEVNVGRIHQAFAPFSALFTRYEDLFIQQPEEEEAPGAYFEKHKDIVQATAKPIQELNRYKENLVKRCDELGIDSTALHAYTLPKASDLPEGVLRFDIAEQQQQEVELELHTELQQETEQQTEQEQEQQVSGGKAMHYPPRLSSQKISTSADQLHSAFSAKIVCAEYYLPLDRTDPVHRREAWDERTPRIGAVEVIFNQATSSIKRVVLGDLLDEVDAPRELKDDETALRYDIRVNSITQCSHANADAIVNTPEMHRLIAQVKFFDGMYNEKDYTKDELEALSLWLEQNEIDVMKKIFTQRILRHRKEHRFAHSKLDQIFKQIQQKANVVL